MSHHHTGHGFGALVLVGLIAFVFGARVARVVVGSVLVVIVLAFAYVMFRVVTGTI
jgi:uncharacterized membrane protein